MISPRICPTFRYQSNVFICLDVETTGTNPAIHNIIEFGAIKYFQSSRHTDSSFSSIFSEQSIQDLEGLVSADYLEAVKKMSNFQQHLTYGYVEDSMEFLVNPEEYISSEIEDITGISNDMIGDAPPFSVFIEQLIEFLTQPSSSSSKGELPTILGHNIQFDMRFLNRSFSRFADEFTLPQILPPTLSLSPSISHESSPSKLSSSPLILQQNSTIDPFQFPPNPTLCTLALARRLFPELGQFNLENCLNGLGLLENSPFLGDQVVYHRALHDSASTLVLWERIYQKVLEILDSEFAPLSYFFLIQKTPVKLVPTLLEKLKKIQN